MWVGTENVVPNIKDGNFKTKQNILQFHLRIIIRMKAERQDRDDIIQ